MDISGLLTHMIQAEIESPDAARHRFRVGDLLQLRVLEIISANRVRVDLGKFQTVAEFETDLLQVDGDRKINLRV